MSTEFKVDYSELEALEEKFKKIPENVEKIINSYLHVEGVEKVTKDITSLIPVSRKSKKHARTSKWSKDKLNNLGFTIKSRGGAANKMGSFGYLVFPNGGRGPRNHVKHDFMERGLERSTPRVLKGLSELIDQRLREEL